MVGKYVYNICVFAPEFSRLSEVLNFLCMCSIYLCIRFLFSNPVQFVIYHHLNCIVEMVLRQTWESLIERKRFEQRREPKKSDKVTIKLTTIINYIRQQLQEVSVSNNVMEAIMGKC